MLGFITVFATALGGIIVTVAWQESLNADALAVAGLMACLVTPVILIGVQTLSVRVTITSKQVMYESWLCNRALPTEDIVALSLTRLRSFYFLWIQARASSIRCSSFSFSDSQLNEIQLAVAEHVQWQSRQLAVHPIRPMAKYEKFAIAAMFINMLIVAGMAILLKNLRWSGN